MSKSRNSFRRRLLGAGIAVATAAVGAVSAPAYAANVAVSLSQSAASDTAAANSLTVVASSTTDWLSGVSGVNTGKVLLNTATCATTYGSPAATASVVANGLTKYSNYKGSFVIDIDSATPALTPTTTTTYKVCIYKGSTSTDEIVGNATFTIFTNPNVSTANNGGVAAIDVSTGPTSGGTKVTISGASGLPTTAAGYTSITVGGTAATNITALSATSVSFVTAASATNATASIVINLATGGTATLTPTFNYYNAITVTPNSGTFATDTPVYITGGGFSTWLANRTFGNAAATAGTVDTDIADIFLMKGAYSNANSTGTYTNPPVTACTSVVVLSDTEILCNLLIGSTFSAANALTLTASTDTPRGAYTLTIVKDIQFASTPSITAITPSATFTVSSYA